LLAGAPVKAKGFALRDCEQVVATLEYPFARFGEEMGKLLLEMVCKKMKELAPVFGLELEDEKMLDVFIPEDMKSFNKLTGRGWFTLAVYSSKKGIITQPAKMLKRLRRLGQLKRTLTHELVHWFIDRTVGPSCPVWLNEGLAQWFEGLRPDGKLIVSEAGLREMELRWRYGRITVAQRRQDYLASLLLVTRLIYRVGEEPLLKNLKYLRNLKDPLALKVKGHTLRHWLFAADLPDLPDQPESNIAVQRDRDWEKELAEEIEPKVYDFEKYRREQKDQPDEGVTPLPIKDMVKKAKKKKKK
jgi:hypothetical protein